MLRILLVTTHREATDPFVSALSSDPEVRLDLVGSRSEVLGRSGADSPHLVILDAELPDLRPMSFIAELLMANAMINTAVISPLSEEEFHEASEGLGVLARLPLAPDKEDAEELLRKLRKIVGLIP
jgi:DNA-binding response OmpR family regulator